MCVVFFFFVNDTATTEIYTLSLHDALPISLVIISGVIWSFSAPLVRLLEDAEIYRLQYLLYRSLIITLVVLIFILFREGRNFLNTFKRIDSWSLFGGLVMSAIFFGWIYALTTTTVDRKSVV